MCAKDTKGASTDFSPDDYKKGPHPIWCPGCGNFGALGAIHQALAYLKIPTRNLVIVSGIGCSGRSSGFIKSYGFHSVHGRTLPVALGVKMANPTIEVIAISGDGDAFAIGGAHLVHACRRNSDMVYIILDNAAYSLTKGQYSPTSSQNLKTGSSPYGNSEKALNPIAMLLGYGATFVARGYSGKQKELSNLIVKAIEHKGFAAIEVISPCITFNNTYKTITPRISELPASHKASDRVLAFDMALREDKIYLGVYYQSQEPTFEEKMSKVTENAKAGGGRKLEEALSKFS
jgi:2-oxoglutarate/2-oxoacid ferredoxin oxidoreductase subunit beta